MNELLSITPDFQLSAEWYKHLERQRQRSADGRNKKQMKAWRKRSFGSFCLPTVQNRKVYSGREEYKCG